MKFISLDNQIDILTETAYNKGYKVKVNGMNISLDKWWKHYDISTAVLLEMCQTSKFRTFLDTL